MEYIRTPREAEQNAAVRMREMGFADAAVTMDGADAGLDVRASDAVAQVKFRGGLVGRPELQNLFGARGNDYTKRMLFFAASDYSQHALDYAETHSIALFVYEPHGAVIAKNTHAAALTAGYSAIGSANRASFSPTTDSPTGKGFWSRTVWPFLKIHWRVVGAVLFSIAIFGGIGAVIDPDEAMGETRGGNFATLVLVTALAVLFWHLYLTDRTKKRDQQRSQESGPAQPDQQAS